MRCGCDADAMRRAFLAADATGWFPAMLPGLVLTLTVARWHRDTMADGMRGRQPCGAPPTTGVAAFDVPRRVTRMSVWRHRYRGGPHRNPVDFAIHELTGDIPGGC